MFYKSCVNIKVNITVPFKERIKNQADKECITESRLIRKAVNKYLIEAENENLQG